jgi:hypothetical protein
MSQTFRKNLFVEVKNVQAACDVYYMKCKFLWRGRFVMAYDKAGLFVLS